MGMFLTLNTPSLPRWATDTGATVEPGESDKDTGSAVATRPPARWYNWLQNMNYKWAQSTMRQGATSYDISPVDTSSLTIHGLIFNPDDSYWWLASGTDIYYCHAGYGWATGKSLATSATSRNAGIDATGRVMFSTGSSPSILEYGTDPTTGTMTPSSTVFTSQTVTALVTNYPDGDFVICGSTQGLISKAASVAGTFTAPATTAPSYSVGAAAQNEIQSLLRVGTTSYFLMTLSGETALSTDSGDTWAMTTVVPGTTTAYTMDYAAYNEDTGRIVVVGETNPTMTSGVAYSDDLGATWSISTVDGHTTNGRYDSVLYLGNNSYVAIGKNGEYDNITSTDDGENWTVFGAKLKGGTLAATVASDGGRIIIGVGLTYGGDDCVLVSPAIGEQWS